MRTSFVSYGEFVLEEDRPMLAPRLALLCKGTAWSQVKNLDSAKLTDGKTGYKTLLLALPTWEESAELQIL